MTPPINSVSPERLDELARWAASEEAECLQDDMPISAGYYADIIKLIAARRAANTPVGPELWGKYPDTGVWHQIADGTNTDEQVADFERCYAEAGWTELRRSNPFASPALPSQVVGVTVKPLEWGDHDSLSIIAHTVLGPYLVEVINSPRVALWLPNMTGQARKMIEGFDSVEDAKAAAQADFNARIQSCLTSQAAEPVDDQERRMIVFDVKREIRMAFRKALADLPEIAPSEISVLLSSVHMDDAFFNEGKRLQREHGTDAVAPRVEQECAAGAWSFMRQGVLAATHPAPSASREVTVTDEMVLAGCRILHPSLFSRGLEPRPGDGPSTRGIIAEDIKKVRGILTAALAALPEREG